MFGAVLPLFILVYDIVHILSARASKLRTTAVFWAMDDVRKRPGGSPCESLFGTLQ